MSNDKSMRISAFSIEKNITVDKIYLILKMHNLYVDNNPNKKLTPEQIKIINDYLEKESNGINNKQSNEYKVVDNPQENFEFLDYQTTDVDDNKDSKVLFKTYGFIDPSKLSLKTTTKKIKNTNLNLKNINEKHEFSKKKQLKNQKIGKYSETKNDSDIKLGNLKNSEDKGFDSKNKGNNYSKKNNFNTVKDLKEIKDKIRKHKQLKAEKVHIRLDKEKKDNCKNKNIVSAPFFTTLEILAKLFDVGTDELIKKCKSYGLNILPSQKLDKETILILADDYGFIVEFQEDLLINKLTTTDNELIKTRIPIVTVMGHVDHGKTTFLDYIKKTNVTKMEKGGITQHLGAYKIKTVSGREIVFLDTPGHEAFTNMRSVSCDVADIVIIIIAADDGVKQQTKEVLLEARRYNIPIVFAFNKIDKESSNVNKVKEELSLLDFLTEDWGGRYQYQEISAKNGTGIENLLEKVFIEADLLELKARFNGPASGTVIESSLVKGKGYLNNVIVKNGKLQIGDFVVIGNSYGKVKMLINDKGQITKEAFPSDPVQIIGVNTVGASGERFYVVKNEKDAKKTISEIENLTRQHNSISHNTDKNDKEKLNIIVKSDVIGTAKALNDSLKKLSNAEIGVDIINYGIGNITETDITLAEATKSIIVTFNIKNSGDITKLAKDKSIKIISHDIIYDILDDITYIIKRLKNKNKVEKYVGKAEIKAIFDISKIGKIAGCVVLEGPIFRNNFVKVIRKDEVIFNGEIKTIKHKKNEMESIKTLDECGICIKNFENFNVGDFIEFYDLVDNG